VAVIQTLLRLNNLLQQRSNMPPPPYRTSSRNKKNSDANLAKANDSDKVANVSGRKRGRDSEDTVVESKSAPAKKAKVVTERLDIQPAVRRSGRSPKPNGKAIIQKQKRRTKAEVQAAKAAAEEAKQQKAEADQEAKEHMVQMNIDDDVERAQTAAKTIRRLSDVAINNATDLDEEEFVGFHDVSSTSTDESEDNEDLEVSQINWFQLL
jgi:hypothetical protein